MKSINTKTSAEKAHAKFSASGSSRWLNCPGSMVLCESVPDLPESKYAKEGTDAHECLEFLLKNHNQLAAVRNIAAKKYPLEMVEYAMDAVFWITDLLKSHPGAELLCETEVRLDFIEPNMFGTLDAAIVREFDRLTVIDYKYGAGIGVEPTDKSGGLNSQLAYYALGISHAYHHNFANIELVIIQPRAYHESGETIRSAVFTIEELMAWEQVFREGVKKVKDPFAPLSSGDWCRFCPAAIKCPELKQKSFKKAQIVFSEDAGLVSVPEPKMMVLPDLGPALDACEKLEAWISKVREHAIHVLERGQDVPGWKLVQKRGVRKWVDEDNAAKEAVAMLGDILPFTDPELLSPAQLEKVLAKELNKEAAKNWVDKRTNSVSSGVTLAEASDKRPAVRPLEQIFGELPN